MQQLVDKYNQQVSSRGTLNQESQHVSSSQNHGLDKDSRLVSLKSVTG